MVALHSQNPALAARKVAVSWYRRRAATRGRKLVAHSWLTGLGGQPVHSMMAMTDLTIALCSHLAPILL